MPVRQIGLMVNAFARASMCGERLFEVLDREPDIADRPQATELQAPRARRCASRTSPSPTPGPSPMAAMVPDRSRSVTSASRSGPAERSESSARRAAASRRSPTSSRATTTSTAGRITIDGQDVRDVTLASLRRTVSLVQQDSYLFTASIENNIAYGDPWADRERIAQSSETARLHGYIAGLPREYGTLVGERGVSLSGGQRQRLADRPQHPPGGPHPGLRRLHRLGRCRNRAGHPRGAPRAGGRSGNDHHRAPPGIAHGRPRDHLPRGRADRRARHP